MSIDIKTNSMTVSITDMELFYVTIADIEAGYPNEKQIEECLERLDKYHDDIKEKLEE